MDIEIKDAQLAKMRPGDFLFVRVSMDKMASMSREEQGDIIMDVLDSFKDVVPDGVKVIAGTDEFDIEVVRANVSTQEMFGL